MPSSQHSRDLHNQRTGRVPIHYMRQRVPYLRSCNVLGFRRPGNYSFRRSRSQCKHARIYPHNDSDVTDADRLVMNSTNAWEVGRVTRDACRSSHIDNVLKKYIT